MPKKINFIDQAKIFVQAGNGGDGHIGFHRAKYVPKGGPDGGDGGSGGDVVFVGSLHMGSLQDFQHRRHFRAGHGERGGRNQRKGSNGKSLEVKVPRGTLIYDSESNNLLGEIMEDGQTLVIQDGGKGGLGNVHFKSSTNRAPRQMTPGEEREGFWIRMELKLLADVGIVGPPNAGKSTLLAALTNARPKIGNYPFTTLSPSLGVAEIEDRPVILADVPGLIEGAHEGVGLGVQFLRHVARTRALIYLIPVDPGEPKDGWKTYKITHDEIKHYDAEILKRPALVVLNKIDLIDEEEIVKWIKEFRKHKIQVHAISARTKKGFEELANAIATLL